VLWLFSPPPFWYELHNRSSHANGLKTEVNESQQRESGLTPDKHDVRDNGEAVFTNRKRDLPAASGWPERTFAE
jgi:hypothetical protein